MGAVTAAVTSMKSAIGAKNDRNLVHKKVGRDTPRLSHRWRLRRLYSWAMSEPASTTTSMWPMEDALVCLSMSPSWPARVTWASLLSSLIVLVRTTMRAVSAARSEASTQKTPLRRPLVCCARSTFTNIAIPF